MSSPYAPGPLVWPPYYKENTEDQWAPAGGLAPMPIQLDYQTAARILTTHMNNLLVVPANEGFINMISTAINPPLPWPNTTPEWTELGKRPDPRYSHYICTPPLVVFEDADYLKILAFQLSITKSPVPDRNQPIVQWSMMCDWILTESRIAGLVRTHVWVAPDVWRNNNYHIIGTSLNSYARSLSVWQIGQAPFPVYGQTIEKYYGYYPYP